MFFLKWAAIGAGVIYFIKNIDIFGIIAAMCGSFLAMCGLESGGKIVKLALGVYLLVKIFMSSGVIPV